MQNRSLKRLQRLITVLSDKEKRKLYDQFGHAAFDQTAGAGAGNGGPGGGFWKTYGGPQGGYQEYHFEGGNMDDIFGDIFGDIFNREPGARLTAVHRGQALRREVPGVVLTDLRADLEDLEDSAALTAVISGRKAAM